MYDVWLTGFLAICMVAAVPLVFGVFFFIGDYFAGNEDSAKTSARLALASLFGGPMIAVTWPIVAAVAGVFVLVQMVRYALKS